MRRIRLIGWTYVLAGFASLVVALGGSLFVATRLGDVVPDRNLRLGVGLAVALSLPLNGLAVAAGYHLLHLREWARVATITLAAIGLTATAAAIATAYFGGLLAGQGIAPGWFVVLGTIATVVLAAFLAWTIPTLVQPRAAAQFR